MTNTEMLKREIKHSGLKLCYIAEGCGVTRQQLNRKINNIAPFKAAEIQILCNMLHIDDLNKKEQIFFAPSVE